MRVEKHQPHLKTGWGQCSDSKGEDRHESMSGISVLSHTPAEASVSYSPNLGTGADIASRWARRQALMQGQETAIQK